VVRNGGGTHAHRYPTNRHPVNDARDYTLEYQAHPAVHRIVQPNCNTPNLFTVIARGAALALLGGAALLAGCSISSDKPAEPPEIELPYEPPHMTVTEAPALPPVEPELVKHGPRDRKLIALTFDACSTRRPSRYDEHVVKVLIDMHVPATIFLGGKWMEDHPEQTRYLASFPQFEFGNHSFLHPHMTRVSDERVRHELEWTQDVMYSLTGRRATLFRAPYGEVDNHLVQMAAAEGFTTIQYDLASGDPDRNASKEKLIEYVSTMTHKGSIVVMHINGRGWHTAEALPEIITKLRKRGFEFVTVSELLNAHEPPIETAAKSNGNHAKP
jgi:peptidoglycan/xylan/chitin deacetylase (PgdA/CDA1 family)